MKYLIITNPASGKHKSISTLNSLLIPYLKERNINYESFITKDTLHAQNKLNTCNLNDINRIIVLGGDGTMHEVINGLLKREDGIIIIDPEKSKGQKQIVESCPHNAISWNEKLNIPQIWSFDAHLLDQGWKTPRAVSVCATGAMRAIKTNDSEIKELIENENLEVLNPEQKTKPRIYYKNLYRFNKCFIGGSIATIRNNIEDCVKNAKIELYKDGIKINDALTDDFGDFKFDNLEPNSGKYTVNISYNAKNKKLDVDLEESKFIGNIYI